MNGYSTVFSTARFSTLLAVGCFSLSTRAATDSYVSRTNYVDRAITNLIEVRMPRNVFVNEYHTNLFERTTTNVFNVYATNRVSRDLTNRIVVDAYRTNWHDQFRTNLVTEHATNQVTRNLTNVVVIDRFRTNVFEQFRTNLVTEYATNQITQNLTNVVLVDRYHTNLATIHQTNEVAVNMVRTNVVDSYRTNFQTLNLTNWQPVLVMHTNWINQQVTNVVQINAPAEPITGSHTAAVADPTPGGDDPVIEAARTVHAPGSSHVEVQLKIKWPADIADPLPVQQWRLESDDGAILSFGQEQEFKRELPMGTYRVEAKLLRETDRASMVLRGKLTVTMRDASVQPKPAGKRYLSSSDGADAR